MKTILVLCTGNSARSQLAQGYLQHFAGNRAQVYSAGVAPKGVNPLAVQVMAEDGIDISHHTSNPVDDYAGISFDYVLTVCDNAREYCPVFPSSARKFHQSFPDPDSLASFRQIRDQIKAYCQQFTDAHLSEAKTSVLIEKAQPLEREAIVGLLQQARLLTDDLPTDISDFAVAKLQTTVVGVAGLERFGTVALLRSVAVDPAHQGRKIAKQLIDNLLLSEKAAGLKEVYLITTTAERYFERYGFQQINREDVPAAIRQTPQFSDLCPVSAIVMKKAAL